MVVVRARVCAWRVGVEMWRCVLLLFKSRLAVCGEVVPVCLSVHCDYCAALARRVALAQLVDLPTLACPLALTLPPNVFV